jgi:hypothetical protein
VAVKFGLGRSVVLMNNFVERDKVVSLLLEID